MAEQIVWTSADGAATIDLTDEGSGYSVTAAGTSGLRSVAYEMTTTRYAGLDGETVNAIHALPNQPTLGMLVEADGEADLRAKLRGLVRAMRPRTHGSAQTGTLTVTNELGETRTLNCYCIDGLPGQEDPSTTLPGSWYRVALKFYAPDPWWLGDQQTFTLGLGPGTTFFPIFPLVLSPSTVQGQFTVDLSDSDNGAFPVWTITGPGSGLALTNNTTTRSLTVNASLASGETMVIDTRPDFQSVRRGDGTNLLGSVDGYPDLWPLIEDVQSVTAALTGATSNSQIQGAWQPRYSGI